MTGGSLRLAVVVPFRDEEEFLPACLDSLAAQKRPPDALLLVDDGSRDRSPVVAREFVAAHPFASVHTRPRTEGPDPLLTGGSLRAFQWGVARLEEGLDVLAKLDADVVVPPGLLAVMEEQFLQSPALGIAGVHVVDRSGRRERCPPHHVHGSTRFYRRSCWEAIAPLWPAPGWDTVDGARARMLGWTTQTFELPCGDALHQRRTGSASGVLRGYRRHGLAAYVYGSSPLTVALATANRVRDRPWLLAAVSYLLGYLQALLRRAPRAERDLRVRIRLEQRERIRGYLRPGRSRTSPHGQGH